VKIVFLSTGRSLRPAFVNDLRANLDLRESDEVCMVSWQRPRAPLPVRRHLVVGPHLRIAGSLATVQRVQRRPEPGSTKPDSQPADRVDPAQDSTPEVDPTTHLTHLPVYHPRRVRQALVWRSRLIRKNVEASDRLSGLRTHPRYRKARNAMTPGVSLAFASSCLRSRKVHDMTRDADIVIALDAASHRGAWTLSQRVSGPDIVIGLPAGKRILAERESSTPG
jgi:hypothetical protein